MTKINMQKNTMLANIGLFFSFSNVIPVFTELSFAVLLFEKLISISFLKKLFLFIYYFLLCWVLVAVQRLFAAGKGFL